MLVPMKLTLLFAFAALAFAQSAAIVIPDCTFYIAWDGKLDTHRVP